ncbi:hypothetical protein ACNFBT_18660 [Pseudomonas sp. NY15181]
MKTLVLFAGVSSLANLQPSPLCVREQARSYQKNKNLMETVV